MTEKVSVGNQSFSDIIENNYFFIDKTMFIRDWWESRDPVTLITRPRRFGKTLNINMLNCFFSNRYAERPDLFEGLKIWEYDEYRALQGTYPVITLSFAGIKSESCHGAAKALNQRICQLYDDFSFIINDEKLSDINKSYIKEITVDMDFETTALSLNVLSKLLSRHYGKKPIILLDEYDTPLQEAYINGYWHEMSSLIRMLFNNTFKTNEHFSRAMLTGITRISKESMFSDFNNLKLCSLLSEEYQEYFGFTEKEVFHSMDRFGYTNKDEVKYWYDGFKTGNKSDIYNPWSIINFLDSGKLEPYWSNSSSNGLVSKLLRESDPETKSNFETLLKGETIIKAIDNDIVFFQLDENTDAIWSLLAAGGYLKMNKLSLDKCELQIVNYEVLHMFQHMVDTWFKAKPVKYNRLISALLSENTEDLNEYMNYLTVSMISYFDTADCSDEALAPEKFYHGFVLGLLVELRDRYVVESNRESGIGRYDVMLIPKNTAEDKAFIIEFKVIKRNRGEKCLEDTLQNALKQIEEKKYDRFLIDLGIPEQHIVRYGFAFEGKNVIVGT